MQVTRSAFADILHRFSGAGFYGLDTETTGLSERDRLFSVILADESDGYYFNFYDGKDHKGGRAPEENILTRQHLRDLQGVLANRESTWACHKFDMRMLSYEGLSIEGTVHDIHAMGRLERNDRMDYGLAWLAKLVGMEKDDQVEVYIMENGLYKKVQVPGKEKAFLEKYFYLVPYSYLAHYGAQDGRIHRALGLWQCDRFREIGEQGGGAPSLIPLVTNERRLTKVCHGIERRGIKIDRGYVERALQYEQGLVRDAVEEFELATGLEFSDGRKCLKSAFDALGETYPITEAGNPSFAKEVLESMRTPVAAMVNRIRKHSKIAGTYYSSFLHYATADDFIHANIKQGGTEPGRFSYSDPNLQNVPKEDRPEDLTKPFIVRSSFVPRDEDHCLVSIDYSQQELRLIFDYAGERTMIDAVMSGEDIHTATAALTGLDRQNAKIINFGLAYGMGVCLLATKICDTTLPISHLKIIWKKKSGRERLTQFEKDVYAKLDPLVIEHNFREILKAQGMKETYFSRLPKTKKFFRGVMDVATARGYVWNWAGRRCNIANSDFAYVAPNHIIQGGGADVIKHAMVEIEDYCTLKGIRNSMAIQVHDELVFDQHKDQLEEVEEFRKIMERIYKPRNGMALTCSVEHSWKSWGKPDKVKGAPT